MIRTALCVIFLALCLNISQISAEETIPSQNTTADSTDEPGSHTNNTEETKQETTISVTESSTETAVTNIEDQDTHVTTRSINSNEVDRSTSDHRATIPPKHTTVANPDVDDIIESLFNKPIWTFRGDQKISTKRMQGEENEMKEPGYIGKVAGNLVLPALQASSRLGKAWDQASQGTKAFGGGAYEAAAGAFDFFKSAASAILTSG